jgi:hypothetical protein
MRSKADVGQPPPTLREFMPSGHDVWRLDADEVHVLQEAAETGDTQNSDLDIKRTA